MILTPPYYLVGEAGAALGEEPYALAALGVVDGMLALRSLAPDTLKFSIRDNGNRAAIPDEGQWITLKDDTGQVLFVGLTKRSYEYPARVYRYECANVYQGLNESAMLSDAGRPYIIHDTGDLGVHISSILARAEAAGLSIQAPETLPDFYIIPKMAFRSATFAGALEDTLKWAPDAVSKMDYSTAPATLRFSCRTDATPIVIDLESDTHKTTGIDLTPLPEARALGISFVYARRDGDSGVLYLEQTAGDLQADANRRISVYLSGEERGDMLVSEALLTAQAAVAKANEIITAQALALDAVAASAQIQLSWTDIKPLDSVLLDAVAAQSDFTMYPSSGYTVTLWNGFGYDTMTTTALALRTSGGALATGWYPIKAGSFTTEQLATAGATKETRYITGDMEAFRMILQSNAGMFVITSNGGGSLGGYVEQTSYDSDYRKYVKHAVNLTVDAINMSPSAVAAAVNAAAAAGAGSALVARADFVEAPEDLAANYFARQDWTPYRGTVSLTPSAPYIPVPGDFLNIIGADTPAEWATMAAPVYETQIDLATGSPQITIGPSPSQDFKSLIDRLRIPAEDNYQAG